ncbi:MAG: outer membrane lipoprotein-sorting protein [Nevskiaceae bacterium]|nr:MAG: outer membrane lipoprotein-sorting protein [Nevskiaceae bacterium]
MPMGKTMMKHLGLLLPLAMALPAFAGDPAFDKAYRCMRATVPSTLRVQDIQFDSTDRAGGTRMLRGKVYATVEKGLARVSIRITAPANVAGAAYLVRERGAGQEDDMFVYLPSVGRVRHVTGAFANGSLLGTDFSYAETKLIQNAFSGADGKLEAPETLDGRALQVFSLLPKSPKTSAYSRVRVHMDDKTCVPLKADFYQGETLRKQLAAPVTALKPSGKYWFLSEIDMRDLVEGSHTTIRIGAAAEATGISKGLFDPNSFYQGN